MDLTLGLVVHRHNNRARAARERFAALFSQTLADFHFDTTSMGEADRSGVDILSTASAGLSDLELPESEWEEPGRGRGRWGRWAWPGA